MNQKNLVFAAVATGVLTAVGFIAYSPTNPPLPPPVAGQPVIDAGTPYPPPPEVPCTAEHVEQGLVPRENCPGFMEP